MSTLTQPAMRARELALANHKAEVSRLKERLKLWRIAGIVGLLQLTIGPLVLLIYEPEPGWRGKQDAPPLQRVQVITTGFIDNAGQWRSFDGGQPITVHLWKP